MSRLATIILVFLLAGKITSVHAEAPRTRAPSHDCSLPSPSKKDFRDSFDWNRCSPKDFLSFLQKYDENWYSVMGDHSGWVKEQDLPGLFALLDSTAPCANVSSGYSSFIDWQKSTVGNEAAWLIQSFRVGKYPPALNSTRPRPDKDALKLWWRNRLHAAQENKSEP